MAGARATLTRWLALDPLSEEASRCLMRVHLALGNPTAALQVYTTCRARLAEDLRVQPSAETLTLAEQIRASAAASRGSIPARPAAVESGPPSDLAAPLVGRAAAFRQLVGNFQQARGGQPQAVLVVGEVGIGKTRLASEFVAWRPSERRGPDATWCPLRTLLLARLAPLSRAARHLVQVSAVLGTAASAQLLWQLAELEVQAGIEALEEAVKRGILREEEAGVSRLDSYRFAHELMRDVVYTELGAARRQVLHQRALVRLESEGARAAELAYHALSAGEVQPAYCYSVQAGFEAAAIFAVEEAIGHYEQARAWLQEHQRFQTALSAWQVERL